jgi:Chalcone isomerase-like
MEFKKWLVSSALLAGVVSAQGAEVAGVKLDEVSVVDENKLVLNGAGVRSRVFIKVYVAALYLPQKTNLVGTITNVTAPRRIVLRMMRGLDVQTLTDALEEGVRNNSSGSELAAVKPSLDDLIAQMQKIVKLSESDFVVIDLAPRLTRVSLNGKAVAQISGASLPGALLRIWLGENPVETSLKSALLGN